jgi:hypothetical protein
MSWFSTVEVKPTIALQVRVVGLDMIHFSGQCQHFGGNHVNEAPAVPEPEPAGNPAPIVPTAPAPPAASGREPEKHT